jgi:hypothetical protein
MKKGILLLLFTISTIAYGQPNCGNPHRIFNVPANQTPKVVTKLGTDPQFPIMCNLKDADQFYKNLQAVGEIKGFKNEINSLFASIGYDQGVKDPRFTRDKVWAEDIPFGAIGMLGDGQNKYIYSILALPGQNKIKAWHVKAISGCDLYFMNRCGNAFYYTNPPVQQALVIEEEHPAIAKVRVKVIARYDGRQYCSCSDCGEDAYIRGEVEKQVLEDKIVEVPVADDPDSYPEKRVYVDVDKQTFKRLRKQEEKNEEEEEENKLSMN